MTTEHKVIGGIALLTIAILVGGVFFLSKGSNSSVPADQVVASNGLHWHPKVTVTIKGEKQEIPANLGLGGAVHGKIHTHDTDAKDDVVHIEAQGVVTKDDTRLGRFFQVWGKDFNLTTIMDKKNDQGGTVKMLVNGKENAEFENYLMKDGDKIEISYE
ncbi:MAG: hypothetical protein ACD_19C00092G0003 [uncultured bacterium]|nr:MAG: hypothetical protein ACD_19C00092G0003 [uncultured bacterium]OGE17970.1 MAG: hypothetical protein A2769_02035 [Candidatus Daviesbacteria bacterium RIFCSPHIGHO2_01_FULL_37_27]